jgi:hypothetical protein
VRLGLIGPSGGDLPSFARMAEYLLNSAKVARAIYLGADEALDDTVALWAESLVGSDPSDSRVWDRALEAATTGTPEQIDVFLRNERARLRLKQLEGLPRRGRSVEMLGGGLAVLVHDKALFDEEDIFSASLLIYGKSERPLAKRIGPRWFLTPGPIGAADGGAIVLDDSDDRIVATFLGPGAHTVRTETLTLPTTGRLNVQE